ncbi:hypothetical protein RBH29_09530 [Herbivorax sp. ANBcel31]|uniref:hypothetical protein n=1 Tax=Herbivorax sp. ANBcel31 TaxID=3069754 RepID=UPI0027AFF676|nr:hypothetical protein [Herbivorax sp. ANBcel31]MDQ2086664.1 hypothetical protein [Herbivorax sp. ANBcel31]
MRPKRTCSNCLKGTFININGDILCIEKGVVSPDYTCSKHRYLPALKSIKRKINTCEDCEYFIMFDAKSIEDKSIGKCQLFTVREYDGRKKKTCSKFVKRSKKEVS